MQKAYPYTEKEREYSWLSNQYAGAQKEAESIRP